MDWKQQVVKYCSVWPKQQKWN